MLALRSTGVGTVMRGICALRSGWSVLQKPTRAERLPGRLMSRWAWSTMASSTICACGPTASRRLRSMAPRGTTRLSRGRTNGLRVRRIPAGTVFSG
ncbi:hypothetical protein OV450_3699 [Actinobacteria bacterium OV450]|nr:hypothetical protein OV450_3699 [Actinobacteria bacterium OV450]